MRIVIISDSHGHIANLKHVMGFAQKIKAEAVIHCGDWDDAESVKTVLDYNIPLYSILGNADIDSEVEEILISECKKFDPFFLKFELDRRKIGVIHNAKKVEAGIGNLDIIFSGHFHSQEQKIINFQKFVRPGAIINGVNFTIYETVTGDAEFFEENEI